MNEKNIIKTYKNKYLMFKDYPKNKTYSIKDIFIEHWDNFCIYAKDNNLNIRDIVYFEVAKMMKCRTKHLGYSLYECPNCHNVHIQYHSCKSKFCTSCGNKYSKERVISITSKLYNCNHRHLVFTIHDALWNLLRVDRNRLNLLFESVNITISSWFKDRYGKHGYKPGFILVSHSFERDDKWNPHIHALIAELGVSNNNCKKIDFIPFGMLRKRFQKFMLDLLEKDNGKDEFRKLKNQVYRTSKNGFYVRTKKNENLGTKQNVEYVLRYCGRPAFAASKILNIDGDYITFWYQRHEDDFFFVFDAKPIADSNIYLRRTKLATLASLKVIRIHDFRHLCASLLINNGANVTLVAKYLGHTKIEETLNTYSHMFSTALDSVVSVIDSLEDD